jgi:methionyl-tRNA formyltransferase
MWVLESVDRSDVRSVVTLDESVARVAAERGFRLAEEPGGADVGLSVHFARILSARELARYSRAYNLHPGYLPWGRGTFPLVWSIWLGEPAGATLHRMVPRVDAGPIVARRRLRPRHQETAFQLFERVRRLERLLFRAWWPVLTNGGSLPEVPQPSGGSYHSKAEFEALLETDPSGLDEERLGRLRRALAFPGRPGLRADERELRLASLDHAG